MNYISIRGFHGGTLYYVPSEKHLYVRKSYRKGSMYLVCYDTIRSKNEDNNVTICHARCVAHAEKCVKTGTPHGNHEDHEIIYKDLISLNAMKDNCRLLAERFPISAKKIPVEEIFLMEMAK